MLPVAAYLNFHSPNCGKNTFLLTAQLLKICTQSSRIDTAQVHIYERNAELLREIRFKVSYELKSTR